MRQQNIEHPDISTLTDSELILEGQYLLKYINELYEETSDRIRLRTQLISKGYRSEIPAIPSDKIADDLKYALRRQQAIIDEIQYRAEMMR